MGGPVEGKVIAVNYVAGRRAIFDLVLLLRRLSFFSASHFCLPFFLHFLHFRIAGPENSFFIPPIGSNDSQRERKKIQESKNQAIKNRNQGASEQK